MPKKLERCVKKLMEQGYDEDAAWAICKAAIKKSKSDEDADDGFEQQLDKLAEQLKNL